MDGSTNGVTTRSASDHTLIALTQEDDSEATNRTQLNGKSSHVTNGHRLPSYMAISCAISGYSDYNRYCSSLRTNSYARRDYSLTQLKSSAQEPVNRINELVNRKNSMIGEALITSRHNLNEDIDDNESCGTDRSLDVTNCDINSDLNNKNSLLEQRIASLYGQSFAKDWRESRSKTKQKSNNSCILDKQRSPSCPPIHKLSQNKTIKPIQMNNTLNLIKCKTTSTNINHEDNKIDNLNDSLNDNLNFNHSNTENQISNNGINDEVVVSDITLNKESNEDTNKKICNINDVPDSCIQSNSYNIKDGHWFLNELNNTTQDIQQKIDLTEELLQRQNSQMSEEICGKLRAAIGKANLLINKKFKQFHELCLKNISQINSEQFITTNDDLEGFWDMVCIQVTDINNTFAQINTLEQSGWNYELDIPKMMTSTPTKARSRKSTPKGSPAKACDENNSERDSERRNRLKEAKRKARLKAAQTNDEITIFVPSKALNN
ncbi:disks large-associated protein 5-like [Oppia nitens]|uniref:disks large-associated protein 5-like n=1 Tax=Oppia nitens TaxID=1686743 RepID=UPI0023DB09C5|nr:disks large-associated protein 5-like [Oppia nitens]